MARRFERPITAGPRSWIAARARRRGQRGAAMVEAALVLPVMVGIVVGILEFGMLFTSHSTTGAATRSGARIGATRYAVATGAQQQADEADIIAAATSADLQVLNNATPVGMVIYRVAPGASNTDGAPSGGFPGPGMAGGCTSRCVRYTWNAATRKMVNRSGTWSDPEACVAASIDSIGVFVQTRHDFITGFFGGQRYVDAHTVMRLEPLPTEQCG